MVVFLKNFMIWTLKIAIVVFVLALVVFGFWWFNLPVLAIIIVVCTVAALVVLFFAGRQLRIWNDKRLYVKAVLSQNETSTSVTTKTLSPMLMAWNNGLDVFTHSPTLSHNTTVEHSALYRQSWTLLLGRDSQKNQSFIQSLTGTTKSKNIIDEPLHWHFLPDMVLLEPNASLLNTKDPSTQSQWEEFLTQIAKNRTKEPINALVITINAKDLYAHDAQEDSKTEYSQHNPELEAAQIADLREYGNIIRSRIGQILAISSAKLPIYILVNEINTLRGMHNLPSHLSANMQKKLLGACFDVTLNKEFSSESETPVKEESSIRELIQQALHNASNDIHTFIIDEAVKGYFPKKDELYALTLFKRLEEGLNVFIESILRSTPYNINPLLRCIAFTCSADAHKEIAPLAGNALNSKDIPQNPSLIMGKNISTNLEMQPISTFSVMPNTTNDMPLIAPLPEQNTQTSLSDAVEDTNTNKNWASPFIKDFKQACFISELFTHIIPADRSLYQPLNKVGKNVVWIFSGFVGYYLCLFILCATLAINTVYTMQALDELAIIKAVESTDKSAPKYFVLLQQHYLRIQYLKKAQASWIFPFLGQNRMALEQKKEEDAFIAIMQHDILPAVLRQDSQIASPLATKTTVNIEQKSKQNSLNNQSMHVPLTDKDLKPQLNDTLAYEDLQKNLWMQEAINLRIKNGTSLAMRSKVFPHISYLGSDTNMWNIHSGELFLTFVDTSSIESLNSLQEYLNSSIRHIITSTRENFFIQMEAIVNAEMPAAAIPISSFWSVVPSGSPNFTSIPAIYTDEGFERMKSIMMTIFELNENIGETLDNNYHWQQYQMQYLEVWKNFAMTTDNAWVNITRISTLRDIVNIAKANQSQYVRILSTMSKNLEPIRNNPIAPEWVEKLFILNALVELAKLTAESNTSSFLATPNILLNILQSSTKTLEILQKELIKEHSPARMINAVSSLVAYFIALQDIKKTVASNEGSLELARLQFGGKDYGNIEESSFTLAQDSLMHALSVLNISTDFVVNSSQTVAINDNNDSPGVFLLHGPYRFLAHALSCVAAQELQQIWDSSVMPAAVLLPTGTVTQMLFEDQGIATTFLAKEAIPFLNRQIGYYEANSFAGIIFPFTPDFLDFIQQGQEITLVKPKDSYDIQLMSQSTSLNIGVKEYLQYVELSLLCQDKTYTLRNSNYPESAVFSYNPKLCTNVTLDFKFPSLTLKYIYPDFASFLHEFAYGERIFDKVDFPEKAIELEKLGIKSIHARILPKNTSNLLNKLDVVLLPLPARICGVW